MIKKKTTIFTLHEVATNALGKKCTKHRNDDIAHKSALKEGG